MKKINRLLAFLLAFTVVITTFSSDLTAAHVYATEEEAVIDSENEIKTVEKEEIEVPVVTEASTEESTEEAATAADTEEDAEEEEENDDEATKADGEEVVDPEAVVEEVVEETAEEEDKEDEDEILSLSAEEEDILITLSYKKGVLPEDAELVVAKVDSSKESDIKDLLDEETGDDVNVEETISFDINIKSESEGDPDNNFYVQPDGDVAVTFTEVSQAASDEVSMEVYHVDDDVTTAESVSEVVEEGTEISFDAEHFSIYTIIFVKSPTDETGYTIKINAYDTKGNSIGYDSIPETIEILTDGYYKIDARKSSPAIAGYEFSYARYNNENIDWFYISREDHNLWIETHTGSGWNKKPHEYEYVADTLVDFYYKEHAATAEGEHVDLRLTGSQLGELDYAGFTVKRGNDKKEYWYDKSTFVMEGAAYELRYTKLQVYTTDEIIFKVKFKNDDRVLVTTPSEQKNKEAFERCYRDHKAYYPVGGFDFLLDVDRDFHIDADIVYHSNFGNDATKNQKVHYDGQQQSVNQTLKSYAETEMAKPTETCTFLGWGLTADATKDQEVTSVTVSASQTAPINVYAIWQKYTVKFVDSENPTGTPYDTQVKFEGENASSVDTPADKDNKTFDGWKVYGTDGKLSKDYDFGAVTENTTVYATWKDKTKNITVKGTYYFGADPERSNVTLGDPQPFAIGGPVTAKDIEDYAEDYKTNSGKEYELKGIYTDAALKNEFKGITNLQADTTLYAKFVRSDRDELGFFILTAKKTPDWKGQPSSDYYPANSALDWTGTALSMDKLSGYYQQDGNYRAIYNWNGLDNSKIKYEYSSEAVKNSISSYITTNFGDNFSESDVIWYVYKKQTGNNPYTHIDGYVATDITYYANNGTDDSIKVDKIGGNYIRYGSTVSVAANTFTNDNRQFIGWNTSVDGKGDWYGTNRTNSGIVLDDKVKLYAQWTNEINYTVNFIIQDEDGAFSTDDGANIYKTETYTLQMKGDATVSVSAMKYDERSYDKNADLAFNTNERRHVTSFSPRFKANGVGYTVVEETWTETVGNDATKTYVINVKFKRDDLNIKLTLTSKSQSFVYDGTEHVYNAETPSYTYDNSGNTDYTVTSVELDGKVKDVSDVTNNNVIKKFTVKDTKTGTEYTYKVENKKVVTLNNKPVEGIAVDFGTLSVTPRTVTLTSTTITKEFDGKALTADNSKQTDAKKITPSATVDSDDKHEGFVADEGIDTDKIVFTGSRTRDGGEGLKENVFDDNDKDDTKFTALKSNTKPENYIITKEYGDIIVTKRSPENKYVIYVKLSADGEGAQVTRQYTGVEQAANLNVAVYAEKTILEKAAEAGKKLLTTLINAGVLIVNAEEGSETPLGDEWTKLDAVPDTIDGMNVVIDNLYITGGKGTDCDYYAVFLNKKNMTVKTTIDGEEYDLADQVKIEVVDNVRTVTQGDESALREAIETTSQPEDSVEIGGLTITPAVILFTADDKYKPYGATDPKFTATISGLVGKDIPNKDAIAAFFEEYYIFDREKGETAGGKYAISVTLPDSPETPERPVQEPVRLVLDAVAVQLDGEVQPVIFSTDEVMRSVFMNYTPDFAKGVLTIGTTGGGDDDDDDDTPDTPTTVDTPVSAAPAAAVLGAVRGPVAGDAPAVLGARRAGTSDTSILGSVITIIVAAAIAFSMVFIKRKKKEEN